MNTRCRLPSLKRNACIRVGIARSLTLTSRTLSAPIADMVPSSLFQKVTELIDHLLRARSPVHHGPLNASLATIYIRPRSQVSHRYILSRTSVQDRGPLVTAGCILPASGLSPFSTTVNTHAGSWISDINNIINNIFEL